MIYTFDQNELLKLLLLQKISDSFLMILGIYLLGTFFLYVTLFYILRPLVRRLDNPLTLIILSVIQNPFVITTALFGVKSSVSKLFR